MGANARRLPRACIVRDTHLYVIYLPNLPMPLCRRSLGLWARRSSLFLSLSHPRHFSGLLTPFSYLRPYLVFLLLFVVFSSPFLSLSLSLFFTVDRLDGGGFFGRCWAAYGERRVLETVRIFLRVVCKTRCKDLGRMRIRFLDEVANNRGDFRSSVRVLQQRSFRREDRPRAIN